MADNNTNNRLQEVIALGAGRGVKEVYFFDLDDMLCFDKSGNYMDPFATGEYIDPRTLPDYDHTEPVPFQAGKVQKFLFFDEQSIRDAVAREEFARVDMLDRVTGWIKEGYESYDLVAKVKEAGGLITLKDAGLEPPDQTPATDQTLETAKGKGKSKGG